MAFEKNTIREFIILSAGTIVHRVDQRPVRGHPVISAISYLSCQKGDPFVLASDQLVKVSEISEFEGVARFGIKTDSRDFLYFIEVNEWEASNGKLQTEQFVSAMESQGASVSVTTAESPGMIAVKFFRSVGLDLATSLWLFSTMVTEATYKSFLAFPDAADASKFKQCGCWVTRPCPACRQVAEKSGN